MSLYGYDHGILKVMSKMGISCVDGYHNAQIFEALGLSQELVDRFFQRNRYPRWRHDALRSRT